MRKITSSQLEKASWLGGKLDSSAMNRIHGGKKEAMKMDLRDYLKNWGGLIGRRGKREQGKKLKMPQADQIRKVRLIG